MCHVWSLAFVSALAYLHFLALRECSDRSTALKMRPGPAYMYCISNISDDKDEMFVSMNLVNIMTN